MTTCSLRPVRIVLLTLALGIVFASLALAQGAPTPPSLLPGAPNMSVAAPQPDLNPLGLTTPKPAPNACYYGFYDEFWKNGDICRWRNSCDGPQYHGTCPNGWDYHYTETVICC